MSTMVTQMLQENNTNGGPNALHKLASLSIFSWFCHLAFILESGE
jgi:hypothetical protein